MIYVYILRINFSENNLLKCIHWDTNLGGFGIQPVFADSETLFLFLLFCMSLIPCEVKCLSLIWRYFIFFYTLFIKVSSERQHNLIFASDKCTILLILILVKSWKLMLQHWSSRKSHCFISHCHLVYLPHLCQRDESSGLHISMLPALCIPKYLCNKQQCLNYWWIHTWTIFHICCISPLESRLNIVYFQVQDLGFNSINKKNIVYTIDLPFKILHVRQSPQEGFPSLHGRYDKLRLFGKHGSKTTTQIRNEQNRAS